MPSFIPDNFAQVHAPDSGAIATAMMRAIGDSAKYNNVNPILKLGDAYYDAKRDEGIAKAASDILSGGKISNLDPRVVTAKAVQNAIKTSMDLKRLEADLAKDARARNESLWVSRYLEQNQNNAGLRDAEWIEENRKALELNPGAYEKILTLSTSGKGDWNSYDSMSDADKASTQNLSDPNKISLKILDLQNKINALVGKAPGVSIDNEGNLKHLSKNEYIEKQLKPIIKESGGNLADAVDNLNKALVTAKTTAERLYKERTGKDISFSEDEVMHYLTQTGYDPLWYARDWDYDATAAANALATGYDSRVKALAEITQFSNSLKALKAAKPQVQNIDAKLQSAITRIKNNKAIPEEQKEALMRKAFNRSLYEKQSLFTRNSDLDKRII